MCFRQTSRGIIVAAFLAACLPIAVLASTPAALTRSFDGPELFWELLDTGTPAKMLLHNCIAGGARDHDGIERVAVAAGAGQSVFLACKTPPTAVLDELRARIWVKSSRPDIQVAARIVLPRSLDPQKNSPATAIVRGAAYNRPGHWQELEISGVPKLLAAEVRVMRTAPGSKIDSREAYMDAVLLVVPGDPSGVELGTDQLVVDGVELDPARIAQPAGASAAVAKPNELSTRQQAFTPPAAMSSAVPSLDSANNREPTVRMQGSLLLVDGRPFLPRAIQWNGEPLQFLVELGFNIVSLASPPTREQSEEAKRHGLWFICVPPGPDTIVRNGLGTSGDRVLAWNLEDRAIVADPSYAIRWAEAIRSHDHVYGRPIIAAADASWGLAAKTVDVLLAQHPRLSRLARAEYEAWLAGRPAIAKPGTPIWASINTQFGEEVQRQTIALVRVRSPAPSVDVDQLEALIRSACTSGVRGIVFQSSSSLTENDPATRARASQLELLNRRLQLIEPWLAGGRIVSRATSTDGLHSGLVFHVDRARLLIPLPAADEGQSQSQRTPRSARDDVTFLIPGVSESSQAYYISLASMNALVTERVAGGTRVKVPSVESGYVVITEDPLIVRALRQRIDRQAGTTLRLERDTLVAMAQSVAETDRRLARLQVSSATNSVNAASMNTQLAQLDLLIASNQAEAAQLVAAKLRTDAYQQIHDLRHAASEDSGLENNAFGLQYAHLADFVTLQRSFANLRSSENLLVGGDFESLEEMTQAGWKHVVANNAGISTSVQLTTAQPRHGSYCLELQTGPPAGGQAVDLTEPRVWIVSPDVHLEAEGKVEITGWAKVDKPFATPGEGLTIIDSLGGPELAVVVGRTSGWQLFRMIRAVSQPTSLHVTFALTGSGSANVDAVMVRTLQQPIARRLPAVSAPTQPKTAATDGLPGPVLELPQTR